MNKQIEKVESWKVKALKELNKPIVPEQPKNFWLKKIFGEDCEFKEISFYDKRVNFLLKKEEKFWIKKRSGA